MTCRVVLVSSQPATRAAVTAALPTNGRIDRPVLINVPEELEPILGELSIDLALIDLDTRPRQVLTKLEEVIPRFPNTWFIALSDSDDVALLREAMRLGMRQWISHSELTAELMSVVDRLAQQRKVDAPRLGKVIALLSAAGGSGATTIAVNLAAELKQIGEIRAVLIDLDLAFGGSAAYLGVNGHYGIEDILNKETIIDRELVDTTSVDTRANCPLLMSPATTHPFAPATMRPQRLKDLLGVCRAEFGYTILDAPRLDWPVVAALAESCQAIVLVLQANVRELRYAKGLIAKLLEEGVDHGRVKTVVNRYARRRQVIPWQEVDRMLGGVTKFTVRSDYKTASHAANFGRPLCEVAKRSGLRKDIAGLASSLL